MWEPTSSGFNSKHICFFCPSSSSEVFLFGLMRHWWEEEKKKSENEKQIMSLGWSSGLKTQMCVDDVDVNV